MKKELRAWLFLLALQLLWIIPCVYDYTHKEPTKEAVTETETELIRWKEEVTVEEVEVESVTTPEPEVKFFDVPLSEELQMHIFAECEKHNIAPTIIIAMIEKESYYNTKEVSPNGAIGLMQVVPKWHSERMERLGCTDLYDPFQNVTVGIDFVAELKNEMPDLYWVLMAYNSGRDKATELINKEIYSNYAVSVVERASELANEVE